MPVFPKARPSTKIWESSELKIQGFYNPRSEQYSPLWDCSYNVKKFSTSTSTCTCIESFWRPAYWSYAPNWKFISWSDSWRSFLRIFPPELTDLLVVFWGYDSWSLNLAELCQAVTFTRSQREASSRETAANFSEIKSNLMITTNSFPKAKSNDNR